MKRFSGREFALMTAPILGIGAVAWWMSSRPPIPVKRLGQLSFRIEKPTTMEAFRGANVAFLIDVEGTAQKDYWMQDSSAYLEIQTPTGLKKSWWNNANYDVKWEREVWNYAINHSRFLLKTDSLPAGELHFGISGKASTGYSGTPPAPVMVNGKWKIDRTLLTPVSFDKLERSPKIELLVLEITAINKRNLTIDAAFIVKDDAISEKATLETSFREHRNRFVSTTGGMQKSMTTAHRLVRQLNIGAPLTGQPITPYVITGRVSVANRWPLDFEAEPFDFKTAKVGQRIRFKQFPAPLPEK